MDELSTLGTQILLSLLAAGVGWCTSQLYAIHRLHSQRAALKRAEAAVREKETEVTEALERVMRGDSKIDGEKVSVMLTCHRCPNCGKAAYITRSPRCYGRTGECPTWAVHHHSRCRECHVDWVESTIERKNDELLSRRNKT